MTVLDLSNHDFSTFDPACLKAAGVERVIVGSWDLAITTSIVMQCRNAGIVVEDLYCFLYYGLPWEQREVDNAISIIKGHGGIKRVWLDCEAHFTAASGDLDTEAQGMTAARRIAITRNAEARVITAGVEPGIYTGRYWWRDKMADTTTFAHRKLWHAEYGPNSNPTAPVTVVDYGGWTAPSVHQYTSTVVVCGRNRDHNYWFIPEDEVTREEYDALITRLDKIELGVWSGSEETDEKGNLRSDAERLTRAQYRRDEIAKGNAQSIAQRATQANIPRPVTVPPHDHPTPAGRTGMS